MTPVPIAPTRDHSTLQEQIDFWAKQAWMCCKDRRFDLVDLCLDELKTLARELEAHAERLEAAP